MRRGSGKEAAAERNEGRVAFCPSLRRGNFSQPFPSDGAKIQEKRRENTRKPKQEQTRGKCGIKVKTWTEQE